AGRSAYRRPFGQGAAAGGRRLGPQPLDPHPAGLAAVVAAPHERLDVFLGARARAWLAPDRMRTRESRWRIVLDQRDGLRARPSRRLWPLGGVGSPWLVLRGRAPVFPAAGIVGGRCQCISRRRRTADDAVQPL